MPGFQLPTITEESLRDYHRKHFLNTAVPEGPLLQQDLVADEDEHECDDFLGYYPDGTKRTLTDDQIAIFRHSEVQKLIRLVRKAADEGTLPSSDPSTHEAMAGPDTTAEDLLNTATSDSNGQEERLDATKMLINQTLSARHSLTPNGPPMKREANGSSEHSASQARPGKRRKKAKNERHTPINGVRHNPEDYLDEGGAQTFRRKCREADEIKPEVVNLDY